MSATDNIEIKDVEIKDKEPESVSLSFAFEDFRILTIV